MKKGHVFSIFVFLILATFILEVKASSQLEIKRNSLYSKTVVSEGIYKTKIINDYVNYYNGSQLLEIEDNIINSTDPLYDYMVKNGIYETYFRKDPSTSETVKFWYNSSRKGEVPHKTGFLTLQAMSLNYRNNLDQIQQINIIQTTEGFTKNNLVIYPEAFGVGINLTYLYQASSLKERLMIASNSTLPNPEEYIINGGNPTFDMDFLISFSDETDIFLDGVTWDKKENREGSKIEFYQQDTLIFSFPSAFAHETLHYENQLINGSWINRKIQRITLLRYELKKRGLSSYILVKTPLEWLKQNLTFPITLDPTIEVLRPSANGVTNSFPNQFPIGGQSTDTYWSDGEIGSNQWTTVGSSPYLRAPNDGNEIETKTDGAVSYEFTFEDTFLSDTFNYVILGTYTYQEGNGEKIDVEVWDGTSWTNVVTHTPASVLTEETVNITSQIDSFTKVNSTKVRYTYNKQGKADLIHIDGALLYVTHTSPASNHWELVDEITPDNLTSYIWTSETSAVWYEDFFNLPDFTLPTDNVIDQIEVFVHVFGGIDGNGDSPDLRIAVYTYSTKYYDSVISVTTGDWHNQSNVWTTNPNTGNAWSETEIDDLQIGLRARSTFAIWYLSLSCTQVFIEITYSPITPLISIPTLFIGLITFTSLWGIAMFFASKMKRN